LHRLPAKNYRWKIFTPARRIGLRQMRRPGPPAIDNYDKFDKVVENVINRRSRPVMVFNQAGVGS
jgi:hypothetical protein